MRGFELNYRTTDKITKIISGIGRSEDIKFSPDNSYFIISEYLGHRLHLFYVDLDTSTSPTSIFITNYSMITSPDLQNPHGVCFLGNERIVVCNRSGNVSIFSVPAPLNEINKFGIKAEKQINGMGYLNAKVKTPGSVDCYRMSENRYRIFVCNNHWNMITSHIIEIGNQIKITNEGLLIENSLSVPDGLCISPDNKWICVSNHACGQALIYKNSPRLNKRSAPAAVLEGPLCPHGSRFSPDGRRLYVVDGVSQYIYIYESEDGNWETVRDLARTVKVIDDDKFQLGRYASREGGVKGIDIDNSNSIMISTYKMQPIAFYNLNILNSTEDVIDTDEIAELCRQRDISFRNLKDDRLERKWTLGTRLKYALGNKYLQPENYKQKLKQTLYLGYLHFRNKFSRELIIDPAGPVVSMTSYGSRVNTVFYAIESIGLGRIKPSRIILWLNDKSKLSDLPVTIRRLEKRGLEIRFSDDYGPHTKYYPYLENENKFNIPLVTADDDTLYPDYWLQKLITSYRSDPSVIHCFRAHRIGISRNKFIPYNEWEPCNSVIPGHGNFITGVSGVIYPADFLKFLKNQGNSFIECCPKADDIWLTVNALRSGFKVAQITDSPVMFNKIPGSQKNALSKINVTAGGNHIQLIQTFRREDIAMLETCLEEAGEISNPPLLARTV